MEAELGARLADAAAARTALEHTLTEAQSAQKHATQRAAEDLASAAARQAALEDRLAQETDRGLGLERQLSAAETARQDTDRRHASELAAAGAHLASLQTRYDTAVTAHAAAYAALEQRLTDAATAHQRAEDRTAAALAAASTRDAELVERLTRESDARAALERDLTGARTESVRVRDRFLYVSSTYRQRAREQKARLVALQLEHETLQRLFGTTQDQLQHSQSTVEEERQAHERARSTSESELQRVSAEYGQIRQSFDRLQSAFQTLEEIAGEHAEERARLEAVVGDRDSQLSAQAERHRVAEQNAEDALVELQDKHRQALDAGGSEIVRLQQEIDTQRRELDATRTHAEALRGVAERVPDLQTELERSKNERRRQFERAPYALCRCSQSGAITDANHSFVTLLGCRRVDELRNVDFVAAALDSGGDLGWLLERARTTRKTETVETQWKTREGRRLVVRLQALATATGSIDIVAEDITGVRALEERLRQAERMEAVGRLASEVAVTCDALLSDVTRGAHEWLARAGSDHALRRHAERQLTDVTRAAGFLRQLRMYGNEQVRALEPVSAQRVLRALAPVLKRVVGDQIQLVLPKSAGSFNVDVDAERLERVLINVAGYARERMPSGGQVRIDLATTAVGRRFAARYSNVRPGDHVLITVTELPAAGEFRGDSERSSRSSEKPGVDLGVLLGLIGSCGGHLWLEAQPAGNMVVKIHLPKPPAATATDKTGGRLSRWFRSTSAANVRASRTD
jgi:nitrogen-specific signal transduction histidine kinase